MSYIIYLDIWTNTQITLTRVHSLFSQTSVNFHVISNILLKSTQCTCANPLHNLIIDMRQNSPAGEKNGNICTSAVECHYNTVQHNIADITHSTAITEAEHKSDFEFTKHTPQHTLTDDLLWENWPCYNGITLYPILLSHCGRLTQ